MRILRLAIFMLLLACSPGVYLHAQKATTCKAPEATPGQTAEQQEAATSGYLAACEAATAPDAHALRTETKGEYSLDDAVNTDFLADQNKWSVDDYFRWLQMKGCSNLSKKARTKVAKHPKDLRTFYLASVLAGIKKNNDQCD